MQGLPLYVPKGADGRALVVLYGCVHGGLPSVSGLGRLSIATSRILAQSLTIDTAAKLRRDAGDSVEDVSRFLDHSSLAVTTAYLRRLEGQEDRGWGTVAEAIGLSDASA